MEKWRGLFHLFVTVFLYQFSSFVVLPAITDVTVSALCAGKDECSLAIYLSGIQQAVTGVGMVLVTPVIGYLSDKYGRKALLYIPLTLAILPPAILGYSMDTGYFYAYFALKTLTGLASDGTVNSLAHAYVADNMSSGQQTASAFGFLSGVHSASFICATLAARFLSTVSTFQIAAASSFIGAMYMTILLKESERERREDISRPILKDEMYVESEGDESSSRVCKKIVFFGDIFYLLKRSTIFVQAAVIAFFFSLQDSGSTASLLYFLKARFQFTQTQFADLLLTSGVARIISVLVLLPLLAPVVSEKRLLSVGLFMSSLTTFLFSISWSVWVLYAATTCTLFVGFISPCMRSIASKQVAPSEQGMAQGCLSGIEAFSGIISPLIFSPLTALFLSERAPFDFPGFSLLCVALVSVIAFVQSVMIKPVSYGSSHKINTNCINV